MPFKKGQSGNELGQGSPGAQVVHRIRRAADKMISTIGYTRFVEILAEQYEQRPLDTLKALSGYMPKDVQVQHSTGVVSGLTDHELANIVAERARERRTLEAKAVVINQQVIEDKEATQ